MPTKCGEFLDLVRNSGALEDRDLDAFLHENPDLPDDPAQVADLLIERGLMTRFQIDMLLGKKLRRLLINGKYKLIDQLGAGGMGSVFLCEHKIMRRKVAIKVLPNAFAKDPSAVERFHREARACAALDHPNIVRAHDVDQDGKMHFLVIEFIEGSSLHDIVQEEGPMDVKRAADCIRQTAIGLQHAHEAGLVHRDIKPANLLLDRKGTVKILDMGLALFFQDTNDNITKQFDNSAVLGTADYLAPEQSMDSHAVDIRADIYSLGLTFFYLLTGELPYGEGSVTQKLLWHQMKKPKSVREFRPDIPAEIDAIIMKMIAKKPEERYQTPAELAEVLRPWAGITEEPRSTAKIDTVPNIKENTKVQTEPLKTNTKLRKSKLDAVGLGPNAKQDKSGANVITKRDLEKTTPLSKKRQKQNLIAIIGVCAGAGLFVLIGLVLLVWAVWPSTPKPATVKQGPTVAQPNAPAVPELPVVQPVANPNPQPNPPPPAPKPAPLPAGLTLGDWYYIGPFDNSNNNGFNTEYPPEKEPFDQNKSYPAKNGVQAKWQKGAFPDGAVHSLKRFGNIGEHAVAYLYREIKCTKAMEVGVSLGSDDTLTVWLNGTKIIAENVSRGAKPDQNKANLKLNAGTNRFLMKVCQGTGDWSFYFLITAPVPTNIKPPPPPPTPTPKPAPVAAITEDFLPYKSGTKLTYIVVNYRPDGLGIALHQRNDFKDRGLVETTTTKAGTVARGSKYFGGATIKWGMTGPQATALGIKLNKAQFPTHVRIENGQVEIGQHLAKTAEIFWEPVLKIGAKVNESWEWKMPTGATKKFTVVKFEPREGKQAVIVKSAVPIPVPPDSEVVTEHIFAKGVGEIQRSTVRQTKGQPAVTMLEMKLVDE
jgi:serine/threonine protein kinase